jgi:hypothetical protein
MNGNGAARKRNSLQNLLGFIEKQIDLNMKRISNPA